MKYKLEKDARNTGSSKWFVVSRHSGYIYYEGTRFDCCLYIRDNKEWMRSNDPGNYS